MNIKLSIILLLLTTNLFAQVSKKKIIFAKEIFDNIVNAYSSNKSAPLLKILQKGSPSVIAQYVASPTPTIQIDETLYDLCINIGKDSANALAIILSHELAHYYNDHNWCNDYAFALRNYSIGNTLNKVSKESKIEKESIADSYGLYYSSIAGYKPFGVFDLLLDKIYKQYKLQEVVEGYPSKKERKEINRIQKEKILNLVPVFEAGVILQNLKYYEEAVVCFDYLTKFFPSREIYSNYGVSKLSLALKYKSPEKVNFIYPIEIDASTRIYSSLDRGDDTLNKEKKFRELLQEAKSSFDKAISLDSKYIKSYINLACLYDIKGNHQAALGIINEIENLQKVDNPDLSLIKAIALYHIKDLKESEKIMQKINNEYKKSVYNFDYNLLTNSILFNDDFEAMEKWKDAWVNENISLSVDTCNSSLNDIISKTRKEISNIEIGSNLTISKFVKNSNSILKIRNFNKTIIVNLKINRAINYKPFLEFQKINNNNRKCISFYQNGFIWFINFKEFVNE